ncbi:hypothetical protein LCGC14_0491180 [marine sediment metagenome]|uniref:Uncharacterized protein n=1 Tax=marine sediment metagenome TaxID=412755 RepID=A0A0F9S6K5_9ZZZZ
MPTRASLLAAGLDPDEARARKVCYVCDEPLTSGLCQRDEPTPKAARKGVVLGDRHRACEPSEHADSSRKVYLGVG